MAQRRKKPTKPPEVQSEEVRELVLKASLKILRDEGPNALSIRRVARDLGLSHGAPYRHFPTREHILAALRERAFTLFSAALRANLSPIYETEKLDARLTLMCSNYFDFALNNPDYYRFMFGPVAHDVSEFPEVQKLADQAFFVLVEQISAMLHAGSVVKGDATAISMFVFSAMHGATSLMLNGVTEHLVNDETQRSALQNLMRDKIFAALRKA